MQPARHAIQCACSSNAVRTHNLQHRACNLPTAYSVTQVAASVSFGARSLHSVRSCRMSTSSCAPRPAPYRPQDPQGYSADSDDRVGLHSYVKDGPHIADSGDSIIENACKHFGLPELGMGCLGLPVALLYTRRCRAYRLRAPEPYNVDRAEDVPPVRQCSAAFGMLLYRAAFGMLLYRAAFGMLRWRRLTLLGQSFGALLLAWEGLTVRQPYFIKARTDHASEASALRQLWPGRPASQRSHLSDARA